MSAVIPGGPAESAGLLPGDRLLALNGLVPRDVVDVRIDSAFDAVDVDVERNGQRICVTVWKDPDEDLGLDFESAAFDGLKRCNNACDFCFIRGLPPGLRRSLYIKDDDFRYSFLYGSFVTLTNLSDAEWRRILYQRLGPLRVSVHSTDPALRRLLLANPKAPAILEQLDELGSHGVRVHAQIVLMPGLNDGDALARTITDLEARCPAVASAAVVPVGLTAHSRPKRVHAVAPADAERAIDLIESHQRAHRRNHHHGFVYGSDELYLLAQRPLPSARSYDDYPQLENGVGLVQLFHEEWRGAVRRVRRELDGPAKVCWATGALMARILAAASEDLEKAASGLSVVVAPIENSLFGGAVSVAGLVPGRDVVSTLSTLSFDRAVLPRTMFDANGGRTIDGWTAQSIADALQVDVVVASGAHELVRATTQRLPRGIEVVRPKEGAPACAAS